MVGATKKIWNTFTTLFVSYTVLENGEKMFTVMKWSSLQKERKCTHSFCQLDNFREQKKCSL